MNVEPGSLDPEGPAGGTETDAAGAGYRSRDGFPNSQMLWCFFYAIRSFRHEWLLEIRSDLWVNQIEEIKYISGEIPRLCLYTVCPSDSRIKLLPIIQKVFRELWGDSVLLSKHQQPGSRWMDPSILCFIAGCANLHKKLIIWEFVPCTIRSSCRISETMDFA